LDVERFFAEAGDEEIELALMAEHAVKQFSQQAAVGGRQRKFFDETVEDFVGKNAPLFPL
jgi:hypothetical protein